MGFFNTTCKKATELVEKEKYDQISWLEKMKMKFHLSVCKACHSYKKKSALIDDFFAKNEVFEDSSKSTDNQYLKNKIITKINSTKKNK